MDSFVSMDIRGKKTRISYITSLGLHELHSVIFLFLSLCLEARRRVAGASRNALTSVQKKAAHADVLLQASSTRGYHEKSVSPRGERTWSGDTESLGCRLNRAAVRQNQNMVS